MPMMQTVKKKMKKSKRGGQQPATTEREFIKLSPEWLDKLLTEYPLPLDLKQAPLRKHMKNLRDLRRYATGSAALSEDLKKPIPHDENRNVIDENRDVIEVVLKLLSSLSSLKWPASDAERMKKLKVDLEELLVRLDHCRKSPNKTRRKRDGPYLHMLSAFVVVLQTFLAEWCSKGSCAEINEDSEERLGDLEKSVKAYKDYFDDYLDLMREESMNLLTTTPQEVGQATEASAAPEFEETIIAEDLGSSESVVDSSQAVKEIDKEEISAIAAAGVRPESSSDVAFSYTDSISLVNSTSRDCDVYCNIGKEALEDLLTRPVSKIAMSYMESPLASLASVSSDGERVHELLCHDQVAFEVDSKMCMTSEKLGNLPKAIDPGVYILIKNVANEDKKCGQVGKAKEIVAMSLDVEKKSWRLGHLFVLLQNHNTAYHLAESNCWRYPADVFAQICEASGNDLPDEIELLYGVRERKYEDYVESVISMLSFFVWWSRW